MNDRTILIEMDERRGCDYCKYEMADLSFNGFCKLDGDRHCDSNGNLKDRPYWCQLVEVKSLGKNSSQKELWSEL